MSKKIEEPVYPQVEKVYAFAKGSIDTSHMAGNHLAPLNSFSPTIKNLFVRWVKSLFQKNKEEKLED